MATAYYCIPSTTADADVTQAMSDRATALGCQLIKGDPAGKITVWPSVVVTGTKSTPVVFPDDTSQAVSTDIATALATATAGETSYTTAISTANTNIATLVAQMGPLVAQGQSDLTTLASSTDPLAPIIARCVQGTVSLAQGLADVVVALELIKAADIPLTGV